MIDETEAREVELKVVYSTPSAAFVTITPKIAGEWLDTTAQNRKRRRDGIDAYSRDMSAGDWLVTGESIKFDKYGRLIDGQHRLESVILSRQPIVSLVVWGLEPEVQHRLDSGIPRSFWDQLTLNKVPYPTTVAACVRRVFLWEAPYNERVDFSRRRITHAELEHTLSSHPEVVECAEYIENLDGKINVSSSLLTFMFWVLRTQNEPMAREFFARLVRGANLDADDPVWVLRERLRAEDERNRRRGGGRGRSHQTMVLWLTVSAWNHWMDDNRIVRLQLPRNGFSGENFPNLRGVKKLTERPLI